VGSSGCGSAISQIPRAREQEPDEPAPRLLAEHEPRADDDDQRLHLLQHDDGDEVAVEERLREQDRRDRRRAGARPTIPPRRSAGPAARAPDIAGTSSGRVSRTSTTCSPKTIV
jgi:hypothetical protein